MSTDKQRKSVSFSDGTMVVDSNGAVSEATTATADKNTAETHSTDAGVEEVTVRFSHVGFSGCC
jgi:translation initiation factor 2 subunit 2